MRHLILKLGQIVDEACKNKHPEKKGYGKKHERKKEAKKMRREKEKKEIKNQTESELDEATTIKSLSSDVHHLYQIADSLRINMSILVKEMRMLAKSMKKDDPEYSKELSEKADIIAKSGVMKMADVLELIGTLKLRKGAW
jgi:predicted RNase H-like nuclease (RuvC/YqgF family)